MALISLVGDGVVAVVRFGFALGLAAVAGRVVAGRVVADLVVAGRVVADLVVAGFGARVAGARVAAFFSAVAVLGLAFAATLFTEVFGAWLLLDCAAVADRVLRFVAGKALADAGFVAEGFAAAGLVVAGLVAAGLADVGRAAVLRAPALRAAGRGETRATLFRALAAVGLAGDRALVAGDFLLTLVAAAAALLVAAFFLGGMA